MAEQLELDDVCVALDRLLAALAGARQAGGASPPKHQAALLHRLHAAGRSPARRARARRRAQPPRAHSSSTRFSARSPASRSWPSTSWWRPTCLGGGAGRRRPEELAQVTGLPLDLASSITTRFAPTAIRRRGGHAGSARRAGPLARLLDASARRTRSTMRRRPAGPTSQAAEAPAAPRAAETLLAFTSDCPARRGRAPGRARPADLPAQVEFIDSTLQAARQTTRARTGAAQPEQGARIHGRISREDVLRRVQRGERLDRADLREIDLSQRVLERADFRAPISTCQLQGALASANCANASCARPTCPATCARPTSDRRPRVPAWRGRPARRQPARATLEGPT